MPNLKEIEETAALWLVRLDDDDVPERMMVEFRAWHAENKLHRQVFQKLSSVWGGLDILADLNDFAASDISVKTVKFDRQPLRRLLTRRLFVGAIAASFTLVVMHTAYQNSVLNRPTFQKTYQTAIGEQETVYLPDGSKIILNTGSILSVEFTASARHINFEQGEAYFEVAKDQTKPFSVETGQGVVTAVGTAFNVHILDTQMAVVVTEGRVALSALPTRKDNKKSRTGQVIMEVVSGQVVDFSGRVESFGYIDAETIARTLDWHDGVLAFKGETLDQVISDISRYTELNIEILGEQLRQQPIGGYFKVGETEALFDALKIMANVEVEKIDALHVRLYRKQ